MVHVQIQYVILLNNIARLFIYAHYSVNLAMQFHYQIESKFVVWMKKYGYDLSMLT